MLRGGYPARSGICSAYIPGPPRGLHAISSPSRYFPPARAFCCTTTTTGATRCGKLERERERESRRRWGGVPPRDASHPPHSGFSCSISLSCSLTLSLSLSISQIQTSREILCSSFLATGPLWWFSAQRKRAFFRWWEIGSPARQFGGGVGDGLLTPIQRDEWGFWRRML